MADIEKFKVRGRIKNTKTGKYGVVIRVCSEFDRFIILGDEDDN